MADRTRVAILFGGKSGEHYVSRRSALSVLRHLDQHRFEPVLIGITEEGRWYLQRQADIDEAASQLRIAEDPHAEVSVVPARGLACAGTALSIDVVFPVLHGSYGEDGTVQGLCELAGLAYVGAGVFASAAGMDKDRCKAIWTESGLPTTPWMVLHESDYDPSDTMALTERIRAACGLPAFIKPCRAGSSVGISRVATAGELVPALAEAFKFDERVIIETEVHGREIECSVLGNANPTAHGPGEVKPTHDFYSYEAKYLDPDGAELIIPAAISETERQRVKAMAKAAYRSLSCEGMARVDFFLQDDTGELLLNEINTIPGFTSISMFPSMCQSEGIEYPELLSRLIDLGLERMESQRRRDYHFSETAQQQPR